MKSDSVKKRVSFSDTMDKDAKSSKSHYKKTKKVSESKSSDVSGESRSATPDIKVKQEQLHEKCSESSSDSSGEDVKRSIIKEVSQASVPENLKLFLEKRPNLTLNTPTKKHPDMKVYSEEEVFILQCHNSIEPEKLLGEKIYLKGRTQIEENGLEFSVEKIPEGPSRTVTLVSSQEKGHLTAETFPVVGKITISQLIEEPIITYNASQDNAHEEFPTNLKVRHPLLGADFEKTVSENIVVKQESPEIEVVQTSQRRSKRKRDREEPTSSKKSPAKKKIKQEEISSDLQWLQEV
ncbi:uncharacterized protein LOC129799764 [Phlebotomus papatasi]|uniref:uncharacterized protein LOC129799764 n=1 Tax=Phlebotomus papatasi TaxID=29031 RepID=UPI0024839FE8|nr:uncharacterized protein LOC129799764 [Phlebotomus papatasi]